MTLIHCVDVTKRYGSTIALDSLSISLSAGEPIALIGPNGAGKTTLLSLLCGYIRPSAGKVSVFNEEPGSRTLVGRLSALPQDASFDPLFTIGRQLALFSKLQSIPAHTIASEVERVLDLVDLLGSYDKKASQLSHGMRKRVAIAQAMLGSPELILLDEPTAGIDPPNAKIIRDLIQQESTQTTFIVSSHNLDELERLCNQVVYLENGKLSSVSSVTEGEDASCLTMQLSNSVPISEFMQLAEHVPGVDKITRVSNSEVTLTTHNRLQSSIAVLQILSEKGWNYRRLSQGKSLEQRLYGD